MDDLNTCEDEGYLAPVQIAALKAEGTSLMRQLNGYLRYLREKKTGNALGLRETSIKYVAPNEDTWFSDLDI